MGGCFKKNSSSLWTSVFIWILYIPKLGNLEVWPSLRREKSLVLSEEKLITCTFLSLPSFNFPLSPSFPPFSLSLSLPPALFLSLSLLPSSSLSLSLLTPFYLSNLVQKRDIFILATHPPRPRRPINFDIHRRREEKKNLPELPDILFQT